MPPISTDGEPTVSGVLSGDGRPSAFNPFVLLPPPLVYGFRSTRWNDSTPVTSDAMNDMANNDHYNYLQSQLSASEVKAMRVQSSNYTNTGNVYSWLNISELNIENFKVEKSGMYKISVYALGVMQSTNLLGGDAVGAGANDCGFEISLFMNGTAGVQLQSSYWGASAHAVTINMIMVMPLYDIYEYNFGVWARPRPWHPGSFSTYVPQDEARNDYGINWSPWEGEESINVVGGSNRQGPNNPGYCTIQYMGPLGAGTSAVPGLGLESAWALWERTRLALQQAEEDHMAYIYNMRAAFIYYNNIQKSRQWPMWGTR